MAFTSAVQADANTQLGKLRVAVGTYTNTGGSTGGEVVTGLSQVLGFFTNNKIAEKAAQINESFPLAGGSVTIVTAADDDGHWIAFGY